MRDNSDYECDACGFMCTCYPDQFDMSTQDKNDLLDFAADHVKHFDAVPCEFETSGGVMIPYPEIWETCKHLLATKLN